MKLQTTVPLKKARHQIDYSSKVFVLGSCFAEHIGDKFNFFKFQSIQNPFGILFHPRALEKVILKSIQQKSYKEEDIFFLNERWHCFDAHSDASHVSKEVLLKNLNTGLRETYQQITQSTHISITLGTAWVYRNKDSHEVVANCHKVPQNEFSKELLTGDEIVQSLTSIIDAIQRINPAVHFIFTISPVRHLKDGFVENQRSKSHLISAIHEIVNTSHIAPHVSYFESYELMMDELRDYRFYTADMVHPNALAIDYIWEKFKEVWITEKSYLGMVQVEAVQRDLKHRPFNPQSQQHQDFLKTVAQKISYLKEQYPFMNFEGTGN